MWLVIAKISKRRNCTVVYRTYDCEADARASIAQFQAEGWYKVTLAMSLHNNGSY